MNTKLKLKYLSLIESKKNLNSQYEDEKILNFIKNDELFIKILHDEAILNTTYELINIYIKDKKFQIAILILEKIIINKSDNDIIFLLAHLYYQISSFSRAKKYIDKLPISEMSTDQLKVCANIYFYNKNFLDCIHVILQIRNKENVAEGALLMFECYRRTKNGIGLRNEIKILENIKLNDFQKLQIDVLTNLFDSDFDNAKKKLESHQNIYSDNNEFLDLYAVVLNKFREFDRAIEIQNRKKLSNIHYSRAVYNNYLSLDNYREGFYHLQVQSKIDYYENLFSKNNIKEWNGGSLENKIIFIYKGNGLGKGDLLFFFRYVLNLSNHNPKSKVYLCLKDLSLQYLLQNDKLSIIKQSEIENYIDKIKDKEKLYSTLSNLAYRYSLKYNNIPEHIHYINTNNNKSAFWKNYLNKYDSKLNIGINWKGNLRFNQDVYRSLTIEKLDALFQNKSINFFILNNELTEEETNIIKDYKNVFILNRSLFADELNQSFVDTIEIMKIMDLNITTDTALAHLTCSLNLNSIILLEYSPFWYWIKNKPNYYQNDKVKLIFQNNPGDWSSVIKEALYFLENR